MAETHVSIKVGPSNESISFHNPESGSGTNAKIEGSSLDSKAKTISTDASRSQVAFKNPA